MSLGYGPQQLQPAIRPPARRRRRQIEPEPFERTWTPKTIIYQEYYTEAPLEVQIHEIVREWGALFTHQLYSVHQAAAAATQVIYENLTHQAAINQIIYEAQQIQADLHIIKSKLYLRMKLKQRLQEAAQGFNKKINRYNKLVKLKGRFQHE